MTQMLKRKKSIFRIIRDSSRIQSALTIILPVLFGVIILMLWQGGAVNAVLHTDTFTLPLPSRINAILVQNSAKVMTNARATVTVAVAGLILGSLAGYGIAVFAAVCPRWGKGGLSIVAAFNAIPIVALAPVMTNWTKSFSKEAEIRSMAAKILVVMIVCIANMSISAYRGLTELKPYAEDLMAMYAAKPGMILRKLRIPNSVPYIFTALRVAVPSSVISAVVSEYFAEYVTGVGRQIRENIVQSQYSTAWAYIVAACMIGIALYVILLVIESILLKKRV